MRRENASLDLSFQNLAENTADNIARWDVSGRYLYINPAYERTLGVSAATIIGTCVSDTFAELKATLIQVISTKQPADLVRVPVIVEDSLQLHDVRLAPEFDDTGRLISVLGVGRNMTALFKAKEELAKLQEHISAVASAMPGFLFVIRIDPDGRTHFPWASSGVKELFGLPPEDFLGDPEILRARYHPDDLARVRALVAETRRTLQPFRIEIRVQHPDDGQRWVEIRSTPRRTADGGTEWHGLMLDIDERKRHQESVETYTRELHRLAHHDPLTGLPNRAFLTQFMERILDAADPATPVSLLYLDLDGFKPINDSHGHETGDRILKEVANRLDQVIGEEGLASRIGGDEFVILLVGQTGRSYCQAMAQRLLDTIAEPFHSQSQVFDLSASIGIAKYPGDAEDLDGLLRLADQSMYLAKRLGRNMFLFHADFAAQSRQHSKLLPDLKAAVKGDRIVVHYQPIVDMETGQPVKAEALARWFHPELGPIPPGDFIPLAEESGIIRELGDIIFKAAARTSQAWNAQAGGGKRIDVNRSPRQFLSDKGIRPLLDYLNRNALDSSTLGVEITEGILLDNRPDILQQLVSLRSSGMTVSLDDFGTGYSSLSYLKKFPIDFLKIDQSFISGIESDSNDLAIVGAIIAMAKQLGIKLIAEGVETPGQVEILRSMGCDMAQGYYFAKPMPEDEFLRFVGKSQSGPPLLDGSGTDLRESFS